jgi:hypothetical protein
MTTPRLAPPALIETQLQLSHGNLIDKSFLEKQRVLGAGKWDRLYLEAMRYGPRERTLPIFLFCFENFLLQA